MDKTTMRIKCHQIRSGLSAAQVARYSQATSTHLINWPILQQKDIILSYLAFKNEVDLGCLFEHWPQKRWLAPRIVEESELQADEPAYLALHLYDPARLQRHHFGMLEPNHNLPSVDPGKVQVILTPGLAFDRQGGRLGFGGGFYDQLLPLTNQALRIGITYDELLLDVVPMQPWDCRVDWLATPGGMIKVKTL